MTKINQHILSVFLVLVFIFYSGEISNYFGNMPEVDQNCKLKKSCACCENNNTDGMCCSNSSMFSMGIDVPCNHPNFEGVNFKFDPSVIRIYSAKILITISEDYHFFYHTGKYHIYSDHLIKPPRI